MSLSRTVSEINAISVENRKKISTDIYFVPLLKELGTGARNQKKLDAVPRKKFDDIFSRLDAMHQRDRRTDTGRQQRPRLRIASRGKNH